MNLKAITLTTMICVALQGLLVLGVRLIPTWRYAANNNLLFPLINLAFYASLALFFFALYSKQQKG